MPYLRITCPHRFGDQQRAIAQQLTATINDLFYNPRAPMTREELRDRTTVHFMAYAANDLFIGGRTPDERGTPDLTVELSDWNMPVRQQRKVAAVLTPVLADLFGVPADQTDQINIRFHSYSPTDFAVGGRLLSDLVPHVAQIIKRLIG